MKNEYYLMVSAKTGLPVSTMIWNDVTRASARAEVMADYLKETVNLIRVSADFVEIYLVFFPTTQKGEK